MRWLELLNGLTPGLNVNLVLYLDSLLLFNNRILVVVVTVVTFLSVVVSGLTLLTHRYKSQLNLSICR